MNATPASKQERIQILCITQQDQRSLLMSVIVVKFVTRASGVAICYLRLNRAACRRQNYALQNATSFKVANRCAL